PRLIQDLHRHFAAVTRAELDRGRVDQHGRCPPQAHRRVGVAPDRHQRRYQCAQPHTDPRGHPTSPRPSQCQAHAPRSARRPPRRAASLPTSPAQPLPDTRARAMTLGEPAFAAVGGAVAGPCLPRSYLSRASPVLLVHVAVPASTLAPTRVDRRDAGAVTLTAGTITEMRSAVESTTNVPASLKYARVPA